MSTVSNRYDCEDYLVAYRDHRDYPKIHDPMFHLVRDLHHADARVLDLCCSVGLLGQRIKDQLKLVVVGVEGYVNSRKDSSAYGVDIQIATMKVNPGTLDGLLRIIREVQVDTIVARRCLYELWDRPDHPFGRIFANAIREAGVKQVYIQGLAKTSRSTRAMHDVNAEMAAFAPEYKTLYHSGQFAVVSTCPAPPAKPTNWEDI